MKKKSYLFYKKLFYKYIVDYYKYIFIKNRIVNINYFYWFYRELFIREHKGICIKENFKRSNMSSFMLFYKYKNVTINQLYFFNSPFNLFIKNNLNPKKNCKIYIL